MLDKWKRSNWVLTVRGVPKEVRIYNYYLSPRRFMLHSRHESNVFSYKTSFESFQTTDVGPAVGIPLFAFGIF